jgi:hypothetical protein
MVGAILAILVGLILLVGALGRIPGIGPALERMGEWLAQFDVVLGVVAVIVGILSLFSLQGIVLILAGLILAVSAMRQVPYVGPGLSKLGQDLSQFRLIIGAILLIVGLLGVLGPLFNR